MRGQACIERVQRAQDWPTARGSCSAREIPGSLARRVLARWYAGGITVSHEAMHKFIELMHRRFGRALGEQDYRLLADTSGQLSRAYLAVGNVELARKWFSEHKRDLCMRFMDPPRN